MIKKVKKLVNRVLAGLVLPVQSPQLKGLRLRVDPLMPSNLFWNNVEEQVHNVYNVFIKKDFTVFDIGANVGLHSYYIARHFQKSFVYAFEPFPANASYIKDMIRINKISNITLVEKGIAQSSGQRYFNTSINNHQGHISDQPADLQVDVVSLDDFITQHALQPDFIKVDVEGAEAEVLDGFKNSIVWVCPTMIIEVHNIEQAKKVADFFRPLDYTLCKLVGDSNLKNSKPFLFIDNPGQPLPPVNMNGQIVAVPNFRLSEVNHLIERY